jgi:YidC/Oxa1 family membrane protein insertase
MDRKSLLIFVGCLLLLILWIPLVNLIYPPLPAPAVTNAVAGATGHVTWATNAPGAVAPAQAAPTISAPSATAAPWTRPEAPETLVTLESAEARYVFSSHGGGLKEVELKRYRESVRRGASRQAAARKLVTLNQRAPVPALTLVGGGPLQDNAPFDLARTAEGLRAEKRLTNGLRVVQEYRLGTNHLLAVSLRVDNSSAQPQALPLQQWVIGTATPIDRRDAGQSVGVQWYDGNKDQYVDQGWFANRTLGCLPGTPRSVFESLGESNVVWAALHNQFFTLIAVPEQMAPRVTAHQVELPPPVPEERAADPKVVARPFGFEAAFVYPGQVLGPGQALERKLNLYAGPKEYNTLAGLGNNLDLAMNFRGFFGWFARALLLCLIGLHKLSLSYGLAIIVITIIIKALFWPLTQISTRSMKRMQALQPQMKALQEKYKDDPKKMNLKLMEFMKEHKISPVGSCLPMLLQIPVFIGFYQMLRSAIELRGARFLWIEDLSQPDTVAELFGFPINPLPLIMGLTQFWQARLTPASPGVDPVQQKLMQYMPLIFVFFLYNFSAGLALYWTVQTLLSILQMKLTKLATADAGGAAAPRPVESLRKKK